MPFVIIKGKRGSKSKELFVNRAEDPAYVLEKNMSLDTDYYVDKQILPPVLRIFESFGVTKDRLRWACSEQSVQLRRRCPEGAKAEVAV